MRHLTTWTLTLALAGLAAPGLWGQDAPARGDWLPWMGCWEAEEEETGAEGAELLVCFRGAPEGVELTTLLAGETVGVERIVADGVPRAASEGGCEGTREGRWSDDGRRVFLSSELDCGAGVTRTSSGVFALAEGGHRWVEIHASRSAEDMEPILTVQRFRPASAATLARHDVTPPDVGRPLALTTTRQAAAQPLSQDAVVEAVERAGSEVTAALVLEMGQPFELNARALRALRDRGVPSDVLDMMVALTWPDRFVIDGMEPSRAVAEAPDRYPSQRARAAWPGYHRGFGFGVRSRCFGYGAWGYGAWCYDPFFFGSGFYGSGLGFGYGWGPGFIVRGPLVVRERSGRMTPDGPRVNRGAQRPARVRDGGAPSANLQGSARPAPAPRPGTVDRPSTTRPTNVRSPGVRPPTTRPALGRPASPPRPSSARPSRPSNERPAANRPANTRPSDSRPSGNNRPARPAGNGNNRDAGGS